MRFRAVERFRNLGLHRAAALRGRLQSHPRPSPHFTGPGDPASAPRHFRDIRSALPVHPNLAFRAALKRLDPDTSRRMWIDDQFHGYRARHRPSVTRTPATVSRCWNPGRRVRGVDRRDAYVRGKEAAQQDNVAGSARRSRRCAMRFAPGQNIWLPFPLDPDPRGARPPAQPGPAAPWAELLIGRNMWSCPRDSGISGSTAHCAEGPTVDDLDQAVLAALGGLTLTDGSSRCCGLMPAIAVVEHPGGSCWMSLGGWRFSTDLTGAAVDSAAWKVRQPGLQLFAWAGWFISAR